ncbi:hypothetical protein [Arachidicoccus terrestris]|uniref:hypothetical protein n=1 Tax=Arachidicoccus terrestris TaxID=2875539 RepID=UPI001CC7C376|nr:hypothetical protein [Arachidicoccus terrestris]UAY55687.1 hypothetical protein K9M52_01245 [Arachidicoccus terrestris]
MEQFIIDESNYIQFLQNGLSLIIDQAFISSNSLTVCPKLKIKNIQKKSLQLFISGNQLPHTELEITDCTYDKIVIENCAFKNVTFNSVEVSEPKEGAMQIYKTFIDSSNIKNLGFYYCTLYNGIIVRRGTETESLSIDNTLIDRNFTFLNSKSNSISVNASTISEIQIIRSDYPKEGETTEVETINIFRTEGLKNIRIWEVAFKEINIRKIVLNKTDKLTDHNNEIFITVPDGWKDVEEIKIGNAYIYSKIVIAIDKIKSLKVFDSNLNKVFFNYNEVKELALLDCKISDTIYFGNISSIKMVDKILIENCIFEDTFNMSLNFLKKELKLIGLIFNKYPSFFNRNLLHKNCKTDFNYSNLRNLIFQRINFENFSFKNFDISNAEFKDCTWQSDERKGIIKNTITDDNKEIKDTNQLIKIKNIYAKLKLSTEKSSDFLNSERFNISEQDIKRRIHKSRKHHVEYILMGFHKAISTYSENFKKPLFFILCAILIFALVFLFSGFYSGDRLVRYALSWQASNGIQTIKDFFNSIIFSTKNILPFQINKEFYLQSGESLPLTQTLELIQRIINLILAACFTAAFVRYLRK